MGQGEIGLELDRLAMFGDSLDQIPRVPQSVAEIIVRHGIARLEADRLAEFDDRCIVVVFPVTEDRAHVHVRVGVIRFEPDYRAVLRDRVVNSALLAEDESKIGTNPSVVGHQSGCGAIPARPERNRACG